MHKRTVPMLGGIAAIVLSLMGAPAVAQSAAPQAVDCAKARQPERCLARQKARESCGDKRGPERRQCIRDHLPPTDCAKATVPERCKATQAAHDACKTKAGAERRQCLHEHMPAPAAKP